MMKVKSYTAETVAAALRKVRSEMGGDAIVLKTRRIANPLGTERAEVTACISDESTEHAPLDRSNEQPSAAVSEAESVTPEVKQPETPAAPDPQLTSIAEKLDLVQLMLSRFMLSAEDGSTLKGIRSFKRLLRDADFSDEFVKSLFDRAVQNISEEGTIDHQTFLRTNLVEQLSAVMQPEITFKAGDRVLFVGPAGAGKSSVMGKLAAHLVAQKNQRVKLASIDDFKIGGSEELNSYADLLGLEAFGNTELPKAAVTDAHNTLLIDSPSVSSELSGRNQLINRVNELQTTYRMVVFSSLTRSTDLRAIVEWFKPLKPTHLVMTMLDLTNRYGGLITAAQTLNCKLVLTTDAPGGIGDIHAPDPDAMARRILHSEVELCKD